MEAINIRSSVKVYPTYYKKDYHFAIFMLDGYLDTYNSPPFQEFMHKLIEKDQYRYIIVDCSKLSYISSTGIGAFNAISKMIEIHQGNLLMVKVVPKVNEVLTLLGFSNSLKIEKDVETAVDYLESHIKEFKRPSDLVAPDSLQERITSIVFPLIIACPKCEKNLKVKKPGTYACGYCKNSFKINSNGHIEYD